MSIFVGKKERREYSKYKPTNTWWQWWNSSAEMLTLSSHQKCQSIMVNTLKQEKYQQILHHGCNLFKAVEPAQQHTGETRRAVKNLCIKVGFSDDSKGTFVCFFEVMFHEFWERHLVFISFFPRYFASVILVVVVFFLLHFSFFWPFRIIY